MQRGGIKILRKIYDVICARPQTKRVIHRVRCQSYNHYFEVYKRNGRIGRTILIKAQHLSAEWNNPDHV